MDTVANILVLMRDGRQFHRHAVTTSDLSGQRALTDWVGTLVSEMLDNMSDDDHANIREVGGYVSNAEAYCKVSVVDIRRVIEKLSTEDLLKALEGVLGLRERMPNDGSDPLPAPGSDKLN